MPCGPERDRHKPCLSHHDRPYPDPPSRICLLPSRQSHCEIFPGSSARPRVHTLEWEEVSTVSIEHIPDDPQIHFSKNPACPFLPSLWREIRPVASLTGRRVRSLPHAWHCGEHRPQHPCEHLRDPVRE